MAQKRISAAELRQHLGADTRELAALRLLFGGDLFPQADAAVALQHLRRNRGPVAPAAPAPAPRPPKRAQGLQHRIPQGVGRG
jgi:hypothetical protein